MIVRFILDTIVGENGVDLIGHGFDHVLQELPCGASGCLFNELGNGKLARAVDADEKISLSFSGLHLGNVDMEEPNGVALEFLPLGLVHCPEIVCLQTMRGALYIRQARYVVPLQAPMQR